MVRIVSALLVGLCLFPSGIAFADTQSGALAAIGGVTALAVKNGFGGAILIEKQGKLVDQRGYGYADRENKILFTAQTIAQIGSLTKSMTAFSILNLAHYGKIDIEKPVKAYLSNAAEPAASATIHQLLTHHAGLTDYCGNDFDRLSKADLLSRCMAMPLAHPAGEDHYSNMGYSILAAVVEQVSAESWENYLRTHLWVPLGMTHTGFIQFPGIKSDQFAHGYRMESKQDVISDSLAKLDGEDWNLRGNEGFNQTRVIWSVIIAGSRARYQVSRVMSPR